MQYLHSTKTVAVLSISLYFSAAKSKENRLQFDISIFRIIGSSHYQAPTVFFILRHVMEEIGGLQIFIYRYEA